MSRSYATSPHAPKWRVLGQLFLLGQCRSLRDIARDLELSQPRDFEIFNDDELHPYYYSRSSYLFPDVRPLRMHFCELLRHLRPAVEPFLHIIVCRDEACFTSEGVFSVHNSHLWARDDPSVIREHGYQVCFTVSVRAGIVGDIAVGPICYLTS
jgi:hypothetical protein